MSHTPKPDIATGFLPPPAPADYSDELTEQHWEQLSKEAEEFQDESQYEIVSGEPW